jgi:hypothetical protein
MKSLEQGIYLYLSGSSSPGDDIGAPIGNQIVWKNPIDALPAIYTIQEWNDNCPMTYT